MEILVTSQTNTAVMLKLLMVLTNILHMGVDEVRFWDVSGKGLTSFWLGSTGCTLLAGVKPCVQGIVVLPA